MPGVPYCRLTGLRCPERVAAAPAGPRALWGQGGTRLCRQCGCPRASSPDPVPSAALCRRSDRGTQVFPPAKSRHCTAALQPPKVPLFSSLSGCYKHLWGHKAERRLAAGSPATPQRAKAARPPRQPLQSLRCPDLPPPRPVNPRPAPYWGLVLPPLLVATVAIVQELQGFLSPRSQGFSLNKKKMIIPLFSTACQSLPDELIS